MVWWVVAAAAVSAASSIYSGMRSRDAAKEAANAQEWAAEQNRRMAQLEAENIYETSLLKSDRLRRDAVKYRSSQRTAFTTNGIQAGVGSSRAILDETEALAEADALAMTFDGINGMVSTLSQGELARAQGYAAAASTRAQGRAAMLQGISGAASAIAGAYGGNG